MQQPEYLNMLASYLLYNKVAAKSEFEFKSKSEYDEYLQLNPPMTLKNETVKSYGEMDIANFLSQNRILYIYEHPALRSICSQALAITAFQLLFKSVSNSHFYTHKLSDRINRGLS